MKYTETNKTKFIGIESFFRDYSRLKRAEDHPQYDIFKTTLSSWGISEIDIFACWKLLIDGIVKQKVINQDANALIDAPTDISIFDTYSCGDTDYAQICKNVYLEIKKTEDKLMFFKSVVKASNPDYVNFADKLKTYLSTGSNELSLWSGGYDLSLFSSRFGKCPLEQTQLGKLLDTLPLTTEWKLEAPLWNIVSRTFVKSYQGRNFHVYIRTIDSESVLLRQEIPMIKRAGKIAHWHIFYKNGTQFSKVGYRRMDDGTLVPTAINEDQLLNGYDEETAFKLLKQILLTSHYKTNKQAYDQVIGKEFPEYRAPFAYYE
ncbi:hypothetical protein [Candidatus Stoquefichus massiliensis]|uniref:hypothetical protein n=1 Tax=Candidatus Stoquefichus massiliensis TaxID=1470350 RepID=UPI0004838722|nr:hypothetical protein [Candidatus Stoquefichus massiliensis]